LSWIIVVVAAHLPQTSSITTTTTTSTTRRKETSLFKHVIGSFGEMKKLGNWYDAVV
jgi:hypothetical protein